MLSKLFPRLLCPLPQSPAKENLVAILHLLFLSELFLPSDPDPDPSAEGTPAHPVTPAARPEKAPVPDPCKPPPILGGEAAPDVGAWPPGEAGPLTLHSMYCSTGERKAREKEGSEHHSESYGARYVVGGKTGIFLASAAGSGPS